RTLLTAVVLAVATVSMYATRLRDAPIYLSPDEATIAVDAHALASTVHDVDRALLPLYFHIPIPGDAREGWFTPAIFISRASIPASLPNRRSPHDVLDAIGGRLRPISAPCRRRAV